jgi:hypothetical protein
MITNTKGVNIYHKKKKLKLKFKMFMNLSVITQFVKHAECVRALLQKERQRALKRE